MGVLFCFFTSSSFVLLYHLSMYLFEHMEYSLIIVLMSSSVNSNICVSFQLVLIDFSPYFPTSLHTWSFSDAKHCGF